MPNWCDNVLRIRHNQPAAIRNILEACTAKELFSYFRPCPPDLMDTSWGHMGDEEEQHLLEIKQRKNLQEHGYRTWYDWCNANWGTKWDACEIHCLPQTDEQGDYLSICFTTAWAPPIAWYEYMLTLGYQIEAFYAETGMYFCGVWRDGDDQHFAIDDDVIPTDIKEVFSYIFEEVGDEEG